MKTCLVCDATYTNRNDGYCSKECYKSNILNKTCKMCSKSLTSLQKSYCSIECSALGKRLTNKNAVITWRNRLKVKAIQYKGGKCHSCGYSKCVRALTFHHLNPNEKDFGISSGDCRSWSKVKDELDKCVLLCANCHAEEHDRLDYN